MPLHALSKLVAYVQQAYLPARDSIDEAKLVSEATEISQLNDAMD